jgi:PKHD-type hydroxylase
MVMQALGRNALFVSAVLPKQVFPPLFNRYDAGMTFGAHVDNAIRGYLDTALQVRTDVSATLFISAPEDYDGGELVVEDTQAQREAAGRRHGGLSHTSLHNVTPITRGSRIASFFWTQSLIRDDTRRAAVRPRHVDPAALRRPPGAPERGLAHRSLSQPAAAMGQV